MMSYDDMVQSFKNTVRGVFDEISVGDELMPMTILFDADGGTHVVPGLFSDDEAKDAYAMAVRLIADRVGAVAVMTAVEAFISKASRRDMNDDGTVRSGRMPSERPDRDEVVLITVESAGQAPRMWCGEIRNPKGSRNLRRELGEWESFGEGATFSGRFANILNDDVHGHRGEA